MAARPKANADIVRDLPRVVPEQNAWRVEVEAAKDAITDRTPAALANAYEALRTERDQLEAVANLLARPVNARIAALEELIPAAFLADEEARGLAPYTRESLRTPGGHAVSVSPDVSTKVLDNDALIAWAKANGYERKLTLYAPVVKSIVKERLREGQALPDGVEARAVDNVSFIKA